MDCCLTNSDAYVAGGSEDGYIYFWDLVDAKVASRFRAHSSVVKLFFHVLEILSSSCCAYIPLMIPNCLKWFTSPIYVL